MLGLDRLTVLLVPFRLVGMLLGAPAGSDPWVPLISKEKSRRAAAIGQVIRLAARYTPWDANCLAQALAAQSILALHRVPYAFFLGVARHQLHGDIKAHAWVTTGPVRVTGGESFSTYTVVAMYVYPGLES